jgi:anti-repressor protein
MNELIENNKTHPNDFKVTFDKIIEKMFNGNPIRTAFIGGAYWFVALDVCKILEIINARHAVSRLDDDEKGVVLNYTLGGSQDMTIINESGLYNLVLSSRKTVAKEFKQFVTKELIPALRKGELEAKQPVQQFEIPQTLGDALLLAGKLAKENEAQALIIKEQAPKVEYANAVLNCKQSIQLGAFCKQVGLGRNKLMQLMRDDKILIAGGVLYNTPYQQFIDAGYFEVEKSVSRNMLHQGLTTYITGKGEMWLCKRLGLKNKNDAIDGQEREILKIA